MSTASYVGVVGIDRSIGMFIECSILMLSVNYRVYDRPLLETWLVKTRSVGDSALD
jgi:hypothetical protein